MRPENRWVHNKDCLLCCANYYSGQLCVVIVAGKKNVVKPFTFRLALSNR